MLEVGNVVVTVREIVVGSTSLDVGVTGKATGIVAGGGALVLFSGQKEPWLVEVGIDKDVAHYRDAMSLYQEVVA